MNAVLVLPGSSYLSIAIPFTLIFVYFIQKFYLRTSRQLRHHELQASAPLNTHLLETIDGLATIRAFGWRATYRKSALGLLDDSQKPHYLLFCIQRWLTLVLDLYVAVLAVFLVALGVLLPDSSTKGAMALALLNILGLGSSLANLVSSWTSLETSLGALARIRDFEIETPQEIEPSQPEKTDAEWPSRGEIEFCDATASYDSGFDSLLAIDHVSLKIRAGEKVAICGRTGSGKSSMLLALFRLLELDSGSIIIDGLDVAHIPQNKVRQSLIPSLRSRRSSPAQSAPTSGSQTTTTAARPQTTSSATHWKQSSSGTQSPHRARASTRTFLRCRSRRGRSSSCASAARCSAGRRARCWSSTRR